jgi:peptidoglycan hydrolase CwlO-like protein
MKKIILALVAIDICFSIINYKKIKNMAQTLAELSAQVDDLQTSLDAEQDKVTAAVDALNATIKDLQDQIANGNTADIQAISDKLTAIKTDLESSDLDGSEEPTEPPAEG